ncbi:MAG: hypothetical protein JSU98_05465 [Gemmatimonadales bacterium]|nr:MAG: hypothetical protein JSU98_05465 [Gemmatimonadales bacterium]
MAWRLGLWLLLAAAGWAYSVWVYRSRELGVPRRGVLAVLRGTTLALVLLLIMDLPAPWGGDDDRPWTLVDLSASMRVPQGSQEVTPPLDRALDALVGATAVLGFGEPIRTLSLPVDGAAVPSHDSRLAPALRRALEGGASRVTVLTDLRVQDPVDAAAVLRSSPVPISFADLGGPTRNAGIASLTVPGTTSAGEAVAGELELFGEGIGPVQVEVRVADRPAWDTTVRVPDEGRLRVPFLLEVPTSPGPVHVQARVEVDGDLFPGDDTASRILEVDPEEGEVVLVSWTPDWEPRFLLPVLEEVTGLRGQGYLRVGPTRFMSMNGPIRFVGIDTVAAALEESRIGIAHGFTDLDEGPFAQALRRVPRLVVIPGPASQGPGGVGEWFVSSEVPASPAAGEIAGVPLLGLPPLLDYLPEAEAVGMPVLLAQLSGRGDPVAVVRIREEEGQRRVDARVRGFWRWAFRTDTPRELYRRLWSGVAAWLLAGGDGATRQVGMAPLEQVARPGSTVGWRAGAAAGGIVEIRLLGPAPSLEGPPPQVVAVDSLGRGRVAIPAQEGVYRWEARVTAGPGEGRTRSGLLVVESAELDLLPRPAVFLSGLASEGPRATRGDAGRPLRTHPLPYLLLLGLLTAEWVGRRRSGLR